MHPRQPHELGVIRRVVQVDQKMGAVVRQPARVGFPLSTRIIKSDSLIHSESVSVVGAFDERL